MEVSLAPSVDLSGARHPAYEHQMVGVRAIVQNPYFLLADEMGSGKTKQTIDAAIVLYRLRLIRRVIVIAPASVRSVWYDRELGQLAEHLWKDERLHVKVALYHSKISRWEWGKPQPDGSFLEFVITNYEFIREKSRLEFLLKFCHPKTMLVLDESSAVKHHRSQQSKACLKVRQKCGRVLLLNGTPVANNPGDLFNQAKIMHDSILQCKTWMYFQSRYAVMGGYDNRQIVKWINLDDLQRRLAPFVLRRLKEDCLDLPPKLPPVTLTVPLSEATWKVYKEMRDEMVTWLSDQTVSVAQQAIVKVIRLAQITSGFVGGIESSGIPQDFLEFDLEAGKETPLCLPLEEPAIVAPDAQQNVSEVGREKLDLFLSWLDRQLSENPGFKLLVWCRFRPELHRLSSNIKSSFPHVAVGEVRGGQTKDEREYALRLLNPRTMPEGPAVVVGTQTGALGLNMIGAAHVVYVSNGYSLMLRKQSEDRVHRSGQTRAVNYYDIVATGPKGQKTIDHTIIKALRSKQNLADLTTSAWIHELTTEEVTTIF